MYGEYMHRLVESNSFKLLGNLIDTIGDPDILIDTDETALYRVSRKLISDPAKHSEMVKFLMNRGADFLWQHERNGFSPAVHIIKCDDGDLVDLLISKLHYINKPVDSDDSTCLHHAARCGGEKTALKLLKKGADPNKANKDGYSPVHEAVLSKEGHRILKLLIEYGGDINLCTGGGMTPLHLVAFTQGGKETMYSVLQCKPSLEERDSFRRTALSSFVILMRESFDEVAMLLDCGSNANAKNEGGSNLLHEMAEERFSDSIQAMARLLMENGININEKNLYAENTPIHLAVLHDNTEFAEHLLTSHPNLFLRNANGETPFDMAITKNCSNMVSVILSHSILNGIPEEKLIHKSGDVKIPRNTFMGIIVETTIKSCEREIQSMKNTNLEFHPTVSFYDLCVMKERKLIELFKKSAVIKSLDFQSSQLEGFFHYKYLLKERVSMARKCRIAKDIVLDHLCSFTPQKLPRNCLERIVYYMDLKLSLTLQRQITNSLAFGRNNLEGREIGNSP
ncbi:ankyrin-1-like [Coccinella septempunctata]|uniref:ankyrin-1-like n=1 Tax=Coccinella septempunctata TaxID=41139 RepID=UPI001D06F806|nr:ankyrin-1-like [Coccinella septempunctata]